MLSTLLAAATVWWLDVHIDARMLTPDWRVRLEQLLDQAEALYVVKDHPLDVACPVDLRIYSITQYPDPSPRLPYESVTAPLARTRLFISPGPGWALGSGAENWAYAWVGYWCPTAQPTCANGTSSSGFLIDPWSRSSAPWAVAHELGHAARLGHREVLREADCSLMAYGDMIRVNCPANGQRLTQLDCDSILRRAKERPEPPGQPPAAPRVIP
jgi:hypothetical protein